MDVVLEGLSSFQNEITLLQQLVDDLGHELEKTPKVHPEIAGEGIEYAWGKSKRDFRHSNDGEAAHLRANALASLSPVSLTLKRIRRFERKAWTYKRAYARLHADGTDEAAYATIEKFTKEQKAHRSAEALDLKFILEA